MPYITLKCKNCGSSMSLNTDSKSATCTHCGSTFLVGDLLDEKDKEFASKIKKEDLENKIYSNDAIKQGETYLFQADYEKAEASFKSAIQYDNKNYRSYLGVVKAKTQNLNIIPSNDDYLEYASMAQKLAEGEDSVYVKSELAKLDLLKKEYDQLKKQKKERQRAIEQEKHRKSEINKFFSKITLFVVILFILALALGIFVSNRNPKKIEPAEVIEVSNAEELQTALSDESHLNAIINLTADISLSDATIQVYGNSQKPFTGTLNGNKHKVSDAKIIATDSSNYNFFGIFGYTKNAVIKDIAFEKIEIEQTSESIYHAASNYYGILAGRLENTVVSNVYISNTCSINITTTDLQTLRVGGLAGDIASSSRINHCSVHTSIYSNLKEHLNTTSYAIGGIAGELYNSTISNSCSNSYIYNSLENSTERNIDMYIAGIAGYTLITTFANVGAQNCLYSGKIVSNCEEYGTSHIAGITAKGHTSNVNKNNYCLYSSSKFIINTQFTLQSALADYSVDSKFVTYYNSQGTYRARLNDFFPAEDWDIKDNLIPIFKQA